MVEEAFALIKVTIMQAFDTNRSTPDSPLQITVLIVDDNEVDLVILHNLLQPHHVVLAASSGKLALQLAAGEPKPDLILLDLLMPDMDGYEVLARLQDTPATRDIPVIFVTGQNSTEDEEKGFALGAVDYITKPYRAPIILARVHTQLALRQARRTLEIRNEALIEERTLVEDIIIRMRSHRQFDDRHLRYLIAPVERTNGDILLSTFTPDGSQWVLVGDFTGHGLRAAAAAPLVSQVFYSGATASNNIDATVASINDIIYRQLPTEIFMTACIVEISTTRDNIRLWSAGMPECVLLGADGKELKTLSSTGLLPFGLVPEIDAPDGCIEMSVGAGERLCIITDGITETQNSTGEFFGVARVKQFLASMDTSVPLEGLISALEQFHGNNAFHDDITFVEIQL
jgi:CheY-like chemotaxis protein